MKPKSNNNAVSRPHRRLVRRCANCRHATKGFKAFGQTHHHCRHPDDDIADIPPKGTGWGTLREWHASCDAWEPKESCPVCGSTKLGVAHSSCDPSRLFCQQCQSTVRDLQPTENHE